MDCDQCNDDRFFLIGCCSGHDCGCYGMPIDAEPCGQCNKDGSKPASGDAAEWIRKMDGAMHSHKGGR